MAENEYYTKMERNEEKLYSPQEFSYVMMVIHIYTLFHNNNNSFLRGPRLKMFEIMELHNNKSSLKIHF